MAEYNSRVLTICVDLVTQISASAYGICVKTSSTGYTLCVIPLELAYGYDHRKQFVEHLKSLCRIIK